MSEVEVVSPQYAVTLTGDGGVIVDQLTYTVTIERPSATLSLSAPGPQGSPGPPGDDGQPGTPGGTQFLLNQVAPAATWLVAHNLGYFPHITILDSSGEVVLTDIHHADVNNAVLTFSSPTTGKAIAS